MDIEEAREWSEERDQIAHASATQAELDELIEEPGVDSCDLRAQYGYVDVWSLSGPDWRIYVHVREV